jgi:hypothetical protein
MFRLQERLNESRGSGRPPPAVSSISISKRDSFYNFVPHSYVTTVTGAITSQTAPLSARLCSSAELAAMYLNCSITTDEHTWRRLEWKCNQQVHTPPAQRSIQIYANNEKTWMCSHSVYSTNNSIPLIMFTYTASIDNLWSKNPCTAVLPYLLAESKCTEKVRQLTQLEIFINVKSRTSLYIKQNITVHI